MERCCAWRRRRRRHRHTIGGESSSDERAEFLNTPKGQIPCEPQEFVGSLLNAPNLLVDKIKYAMLRSADVNDDEYNNWTPETFDLIRDGSGSVNWLQTPIRKGVPDDYKRYAILRASLPSGGLEKHSDEFVRLLEQRVFGDNVPDTFTDELPTYTFGFLGPEQELHQKAKDLDILVDLGRYTDPRGSLPEAGVMPGAVNSARHALGGYARLGSFSHPPQAGVAATREYNCSRYRTSNESFSQQDSMAERSFVPDLPAAYSSTAMGCGRLQRSASLHEYQIANGHQRITRTDSDTQLLDQLSPEAGPTASLRTLMSSAHNMYNSSPTRMGMSAVNLKTCASKIKEGAITGDNENARLSFRGGESLSGQLSKSIGGPSSNDLRKMLTTLKTMQPAPQESLGHTLLETTAYASILTKEGCYVASKIIWLINGYFPQVEFAPILAPLICIMLFYVDEREALATIMHVLERSCELLRNKSPRAFITLRRSEFVRLVKQAVAISEKCLGRLTNHLKDLGVDLPAWIARGLQDGFSHIVPFDLLVRMYIAFLFDGSKAFLRYGLAMLLTAEDRLLQCCSAEEANRVLLFRELRSCEPQHLNELTKLAYSLRIKYNKQPLAQYLASGEPPTPYLQKTAEPSRFYRPRMYDYSEILSDAAWIKIWRYLPDHRRILDPYLRFTTSKHGCSINAMIRALWNHSDLAMIGAIYTGTKETIIMHSPVTFRADFKSVMHTIDPSEAFVGRFEGDERQNLKVWYNSSTGNRIMIVNNEAIYFGDPHILSIDRELNRGQSLASNTSPVLVDNKFGDFTITIMEIWVLE